MITVDLPLAFYDDHEERDLPSGKELKRTKRYVRVELDEESFSDLLDDARHYADPYGPDVGPGLKASARATVKKLEASRQ